MQTLIKSPFQSVLQVAACLALLLAVPQAQAQDAARDHQPSVTEPVVRIVDTQSRVSMVETFAKVLELNNKIARVDGFDPEIVSITGLSTKRLRVQAVMPGITTVAIEDERGDVRTVEIFVVGDVRHLQAYLNRLFPRAAVEAIPIQENVVLRGWVTQPEHIAEMVEVASMFFPNVANQMRVGGTQQVLLKVRVMEVQRTKLRRLGINWFYFNNDFAITSTPGSLAPVGALGGGGGVSVIANALSDTTNILQILTDDSNFTAFFDALKSESLLKILAEPELVAANGRPANLLSGGEFPILVPQSLGTVTIEWREFGVRLEAVPIIIGNDRVRLELQPEVSERDFTNAVDLNGTIVPGLTTRRVNTQVEMKFGQTLMLAGLISTRKTADTDKTPFLGELPYVGAAFRRIRYDETETELVIMVTPELLAPLDADQVPCGGPGLFTTTPTDRELYLDGMIEIPNYGDECAGCAAGSCNLHPAGGHVGTVPVGIPHPIQGGEIHGGEIITTPPQPVPPQIIPPSPAAAEGETVHRAPTPRGPRPATAPAMQANVQKTSSSNQPVPRAKQRPGLIEPAPGLIAP